MVIKLSLISGIAAGVRPLGVALAHEVIRTKLGTPRMELLNRLHLALSPSDQLEFRVELRWCRLAKRGMVEAIISRGA